MLLLEFISTNLELLSPIIGLLAPLCWWYGREWKILGTPSNDAFGRRVSKLDQSKYDYAKLYKDRLKSFLSKIDGILGPPKYFGSNVSIITHLLNYLSKDSYRTLAIISIFYPTTIYLIFWIFGGANGFGIFGQIPEFSGVFTRAILFAFYYSLLYKLYRHRWLDSRKSIALNLVVFFVYFYVSYFISLGTGYFLITMPLMILVVLGGGVKKCISIFFFSGVLFALMTLTILLLAHKSGGVYYDLEDAATAAVLKIFISSLAFLIPLGIHLFVSTAHSALQPHTHWSISIILAFFIYGLYLIWMSKYGHSAGYYPQVSLFMFFWFTPLINLPLDWLSVATTRALLHKIANGESGVLDTYLSAFLDICLALIFLIAVVIISVLTITFIQYLTSSITAYDQLSQNEIYEAILQRPWKENLWIWVVMLSTLLPTVVHLLVALLALNINFSSKKMKLHKDRLQKVFEECKQLKAQSLHGEAINVTVDSDSKLYAFIHLVIGRTLVWVIWFLLVVVLTFTIVTVVGKLAIHV